MGCCGFGVVGLDGVGVGGGLTTAAALSGINKMMANAAIKAENKTKNLFFTVITSITNITKRCVCWL